MKLPAVHFAVNVAGLTSAIGSVAGFALSPGGQTCIASLQPKDALLATAVAGAIAAFLPTKHTSPAQSAQPVNSEISSPITALVNTHPKGP